MRDKKFAIGICISMVWIAAAIWVLLTQERPTKINEWGDFIAGFSAPLAFFWLVLGYMQQGEELQHSTEALRLQAEELKNSVEQQTQLVAVTREQMQMEIAALADEKQARAEAARPRFVPQQSSVEIDGTGVVTGFHISIVNMGQAVTRVRTNFEMHGRNLHSEGLAIVRNQDRIQALLEIRKGQMTVGSIDYVDSFGVPGMVFFEVRVVADRRLEFGEVTQAG